MPTGVTGSIKRNTEPQPLEGLPPVPPQTSSHKRPSVGKTGSQPLGIIPQVSESQNFEPINATTKEDEVLEEDISIPTITPPPIPQTPMDVIKLPARTSSRKASEERFKQTMLDAPAITGSIEVLDSNAPTEALVNTSETEALMEALDVMSNIPSHLEEPTSYSGATEPLMMQEDMELPNELENLQGFQPVANQTGIMSDNTGLMSEAVSTSVLDNLSTEEVMSNLTDLVEGFTTPLSVEDAQPIIDEEQAEQLFVAGRNHFQSRDVAGAVRSLREAVRLAPRQTRYRLLLGHVLSNNQRWQKEAEEQFRQVLDIEPVNVMAHLGLAQLYSKVGLVRRAENEYREALKIEPQNPVAKKGLKAIIGEDTLGIPIFLSKLLPNSTR
jgi:hypothetical protein